MNRVLETLFGTTFPDLASACSAGRAEHAEVILRHGAPATAAADRPVAAAVWAPSAWARIERMTRVDHDRPADEVLTTMLSALHRLAEPVTFEVSRAHAAMAVRIGFATPTSRTWAARLLAPQVLLSTESTPSPPERLPELTSVRFRRAVPARPRSTPVVRERLSFLGRLASVENGTWRVTLALHPHAEATVREAGREVGTVRRSAARHVSRTRTADELTQIVSDDPVAQRVVDWLTELADGLEGMSAIGGWDARIAVHADDDLVCAQVSAAVAGHGPAPADDDRVHVADVLDGEPDRARFLVDSAEAATWLATPTASFGGVDVGSPLPAGRRNVPAAREILLGSWLGTDDHAVVGVDDLAGHAFVAGVTGSGKSATLARMLVSAWNRHGVPFLVIDPVKADYAAMASLVRGGLTVVSGREVRMNVLAPVEGFDPMVHLDLVSAAFKGAFAMPSPVPYVTTMLFDQIKEQVAAGARPTLHDARRAVAPLVTSFGYRGELEANILASLGMRLAVLTSPVRADLLCARESSLAVFDRPTVISLADLGDAEEQAFVMAMLVIHVAEQARLRGPRATVAHLTVIEEAHRLVSEPRPGGEDVGDAAGHAARLVAQLLAEIRSTGESVVLLDQSPAAVARDVVRNTNTKIVHRVLDPADRELLGGSMGIAVEDTEFLSELAPGQAVLSHARLPRPQMVQVMPPFDPANPPVYLAPAPGPARACCGHDGRAHSRAERVAVEAGAVVLAAATAALTGGGPEPRVVAELTRRRLAQLAVRSPGVAVACLLDIGARVCVDAWLAEEWITRDEVDPLHTGIVAAMTGTGPDRPHLPVVTTPPHRPFADCAPCGHACVVRPLGRQNPWQSRLATLAESTATERLRVTLAAARDDIVPSLADVVGWAAANDTFRCVVLHATGRYETVPVTTPAGVA